MVLRLVSRWPLSEIASAPASQSPLTSFCRSESSTSLRALSAPGASSATTRTPGPRTGIVPARMPSRLMVSRTPLGRGVAAELSGLQLPDLAAGGTVSVPGRRRPGARAWSTWPTSSRRSRSLLDRVARGLHGRRDDEHGEHRHHQRADDPDPGFDAGSPLPRRASASGGARRRTRSPRPSRAW